MKKQKHQKDYECLFDQTSQISIAEMMMKQEGILLYRTKTITSGTVVECEIYPIWQKPLLKKAKGLVTSKAQQEVNKRNARKKVNRLLNTNFSSKDCAVHLTYAGEAPDCEQAKKDIQNYIRRIKEYRKRRGMSELKYLYVIEFDEGTPEKPKKRIHSHMVISGMDRDDAQKLWGKGWCNCDRLQPNDHGLENLAAYMMKDPKGQKRWACSRNLSKPDVSTADHKFTIRKVERIMQQMKEQTGKIFAEKFPKCRLLDSIIMTSEQLPGAYIYATMTKIQEGKNKSKRKAGRVNDR